MISSKHVFEVISLQATTTEKKKQDLRHAPNHNIPKNMSKFTDSDNISSYADWENFLILPFVLTPQNLQLNALITDHFLSKLLCGTIHKPYPDYQPFLWQPIKFPSICKAKYYLNADKKMPIKLITMWAVALVAAQSVLTLCCAAWSIGAFILINTPIIVSVLAVAFWTAAAISTNCILKFQNAQDYPKLALD